MRDRQVRFFANDRRQHLQGAHPESDKLRGHMLAVVPAKSFVGNAEQVRKLTHLETISGSDDDGVALALEFLDNGLEERNVGGILEVDPDFPRPSGTGVVVLTFVRSHKPPFTVGWEVLVRKRICIDHALKQSPCFHKSVRLLPQLGTAGPRSDVKTSEEKRSRALLVRRPRSRLPHSPSGRRPSAGAAELDSECRSRFLRPSNIPLSLRDPRCV